MSVFSCVFHGSVGICYPWIEVISGQVDVSELGKGSWAGCVPRYQWKRAGGGEGFKSNLHFSWWVSYEALLQR